MEIQTASKCLYHAGLVMPLCGERDEPRVIVGVIPEKARVFNTKTRAPYMVPLETVKLSEVKRILFENYEWSKYFNPANEDIQEMSSNQRETQEEEFKLSLMKQFNQNNKDCLSQSEF